MKAGPVTTKLQHTSIRASAGTGKTYQLANRYLALLLLQATRAGEERPEPEKIVALTFTRKGAGEFAQRILHRLSVAAGDPSELDTLRADLNRLIQGVKGVPGLAPGIKLGMDTATLQSALAVMVDQFDRLILGTIDSFMARSVQTLAFELGLGGFEILETAAQGRQRDELLAAVLRAVPERDLAPLFQTFKFATLQSSSSLRKDLELFVEGYHKLFHALPEKEAWGGRVFWNGDAPSAAATDWQDGAAKLASRVETHDFGHKTASRSFASALNWLASRTPGTSAGGQPPSWLGEDGILLRLWVDWPAGEWSFEFSRKQCVIPVSILNPLKPVLEAWLSAECGMLSRKTGAIHDVVSRYEKLYDREARRRGRLAFDDLPLLLNEPTSDDAARDTLARLGFRWYQALDHWLLDEFQDTSRTQWGVLKPWLDEAIQDNDGTKSVFVVGDAKQSIYGWRGGEPRLFDDLAVSYPGEFSEQTLAQSWRSRPAVLALVNRICTPTTNPSLSDPDQFSPAALKRWRYQEHISAEGLRSQEGYAAVLFASEDELASASQEASGAEVDGDGELADKLAAQARVIKEVLGRVRPLERGLSCAILVRKNANARPIAQWLHANGVPQVMVEGDTTLAEQSPVVSAIVDALRWLGSPASGLAAGHIKLTPLWEVLQEPAKQPETETIHDGHVWRHWRQRIADTGAPLVTHEWCMALAPGQPEAYTQYCLRQVSEAAQQGGAPLALPDWLATLEQLTVRETASAGSIHIMTIHKAKGLGFDVVFLPDLDGGTKASDSVLLARDLQGHITGCLAYPPRWLQPWNPLLAERCAAQRADKDLEALCLLYVALTRSQEATFVILKREKPRNASPAREWILSAISHEGANAADPSTQYPWGAGELLWECGSREFAADRTGPAAAATPPPDVLQLLKPTPRRERRRPSDAGHEASAQAVAITGQDGGRVFGTAVHDVFEQIEWWTPGQALQGDQDAIALVRRCLAVPDIQALFTRENELDEALCELPVEFPEKNLWWSGVIDRLVLRRDDDGSLRKAVVIDFKTDCVQNIALLRDRYAEQLRIYRRAVSSALKLQANEVEVILLSTHLAAPLRP